MEEDERKTAITPKIFFRLSGTNVPESQQTPLISVIIPIHNRAHEIGRALESVRAQLYPNLEIIIVDDGSDDDLKGSLAPFPNLPITLLHRKIRQGAGAARNTGIKASRGDYIAFLDSDDDCLEKHSILR